MVKDFDGEKARNNVAGSVCEHYAVEFAIQQVKNCSIPDVVGQSEQLSCNTCKFYPVDYNSFCATCKNFEKHVKAT